MSTSPLCTVVENALLGLLTYDDVVFDLIDALVRDGGTVTIDQIHICESIADAAMRRVYS